MLFEKIHKYRLCDICKKRKKKVNLVIVKTYIKYYVQNRAIQTTICVTIILILINNKSDSKNHLFYRGYLRIPT